MNNVRDKHNGGVSDKELLMFVYFGIQLGMIRYLSISDMYQIMVNDAFMKNMEGPAVESLRRCFSAFRNCTTFRETPEFDDLIRMSDEELGEIFSRRGYDVHELGIILKHDERVKQAIQSRSLTHCWSLPTDE